MSKAVDPSETRQISEFWGNLAESRATHLERLRSRYGCVPFLEQVSRKDSYYRIIRYSQNLCDQRSAYTLHEVAHFHPEAWVDMILTNSDGNIEGVPSHGRNRQETDNSSTHLEAKDKGLRKQLQALTAERDKLASQIELLVSRVAEARRTAAREIQRFDQLQRDHAKLRERNDLLVDRLNERAKANDLVFSSLSVRPGCKIRMAQTYEGVVEEADDDHVVVVYEVDGDIVEQTYLKNQFQDQRLPEVGARLAVYVTVAEVQRTSSQDHSETEETSSRDDIAGSGRKALKDPVEF